MAKQIREKQFNVQQAAKVATEGSAFDDSGVRLAQSLSSLVSDAGQFGEQLSGMYARGKEQELKKQEKISEDRAYDDLALGLQQDPNFLSKHDTLPPGWTDVKWTAYNTMKAKSDLVTFSRNLDTEREIYINSIANDPNRSFIQGELDTIYQNVFDKALRTSNGNGSWMQVFLPQATSALQQRATADRADRAKRTQAAFEEKSNNSILAAISNFDFSSITPEVQKQADAYFIYSEGENATPNDTLNYGRASQISKAYQENRQLRKDLGLSVDKEAMVNVFKQLASQSEDLTPVMEILLDMEMPGTGLTYGESGQRVELLKVLEDAQDDRLEGMKNSVTVKVFDLIGSNRTETRTQLDTIAKSTEVTSLVNFHDILRNQNIELDKVEEEILKTSPENKSELLKALDRQRLNNNNLISRGNGVFFADQTNSSQRSRIFKARMLGQMSDYELWDERSHLTVEDYEDLLYLQDDLREGTTVILREFVKLLGVDPGERTIEDIMGSQFFKKGRPESIALNAFTEKLFAGGNEQIIEYYNKYDTKAETIQTKFLKDEDVSLIYNNFLKAVEVQKNTEETNFQLYNDNKENFYKTVTSREDLIAVYKRLGSDPDRQEFVAGLTLIQRTELGPYLDE